jgi:hypothetical protein
MITLRCISNMQLQFRESLLSNLIGFLKDAFHYLNRAGYYFPPPRLLRVTYVLKTWPCLTPFIYVLYLHIRRNCMCIQHTVQLSSLNLEKVKVLSRQPHHLLRKCVAASHSRTVNDNSAALLHQTRHESLCRAPC